MPPVSIEFSPNIKIQEEIPQPNPELGDYSLMISTKSKIDPYVDKWDSVKFLLNDYEVVDIYRNKDLAQKRYTEAIIDYKQQSYIFSRAYFKIWEVIDTYKVLGIIFYVIYSSSFFKYSFLLDKYKNVGINICNLAEGPGGFIHSLIDFRNK